MFSTHDQYVFFLAKFSERFQLFFSFLFNSLSPLPPSAQGILDPPMYAEVTINTRRNSAYLTDTLYFK